MKKDLYSFLREILDIIEYPEDKEAFVTQFYQLNYLEALLSIVPQLPKETQEKIKACNNDSEKIKEYIPADVYKRELQQVTTASLKDFIQSISVDLSRAQKEKIAHLVGF